MNNNTLEFLGEEASVFVEGFNSPTKEGEKENGNNSVNLERFGSPDLLPELDREETSPKSQTNRTATIEPDVKKSLLSNLRNFPRKIGNHIQKRL